MVISVVIYLSSKRYSCVVFKSIDIPLWAHGQHGHYRRPQRPISKTSGRLLFTYGCDKEHIMITSNSEKNSSAGSYSRITCKTHNPQRISLLKLLLVRNLWDVTHHHLHLPPSKQFLQLTVAKEPLTIYCTRKKKVRHLVHTFKKRS